MGTVPNQPFAAHTSGSGHRRQLVWPPFDPHTSGPGYVYVKLADYLADRIADGRLPDGAMLLCERRLAQEYGVSVGTARRAVQRLRERNLVLTLPSRGTYVRSPG